MVDIPDTRGKFPRSFLGQTQSSFEEQQAGKFKSIFVFQQWFSSCWREN